MNYYSRIRCLCFGLFTFPNIRMYKQDLGLNNQQGFICHKTKPTNQPDYKCFDFRKIKVQFRLVLWHINHCR